MNRDQLVKTIGDRLGDRLLEVTEKSSRRVFVEVRPADVPDATRLLFRELGARFQIASGVDTPDAIEVLYHWAFDALDCIVTLRTRLDREHPELASLAALCKGTEWIERELWELLGIQFTGHPDLRHLLLKEDWPEGQYPLRRDYRKT